MTNRGEHNGGKTATVRDTEKRQSEKTTRGMERRQRERKGGKEGRARGWREKMQNGSGTEMGRAERSIRRDEKREKEVGEKLNKSERDWGGRGGEYPREEGMKEEHRI